MHFWNKITKMDWDNLPDIRCSWLADSQQETLLTVGRSCLLMVVWCRFSARLRLRFSACFVRDNCQCHVENKEEWKVNCQNRNCRKLFCFFWVFLSMFWENWVILPLGSPDWMLLSVLAVAKPRSRLFYLLSSKILQNNLLDLHLVEICRYKLSFYAKQPKHFSLRTAIFFTFLKNHCAKLKTRRGLELGT